MWERYCRGVNAIVYMVDAADQDKIEVRHLVRSRRLVILMGSWLYPGISGE